MNRYWVGNSGDWTDTAHWSATDGGGGGASVPTATDNAYFTANSFSLGAQTVTQPSGSTCQCLDFIWTGVTNTPNFLSEADLFLIWGGMTLVAGMTWDAGTYCTLAFAAASGTHNITTAGIAITLWGSDLDFGYETTGGKWVLQDDFTHNYSNGSTFLSWGHLDTNGKTMTLALFGTLAGAPGMVLTLGASVINCKSFNFSHTTGDLVFNEGTSQINIGNTSGGSSGFKPNGETFYNVTWTHYNGVDQVSTGTSSNDATFNNFTSLGANYYESGFYWSGVAGSTFTFTVNGTFTATGFSAAMRLLINNNTLGTAITINAAAVALTNVDFRDVTAGGAAAPFTGTILGDCGGNTNITTNTPVTRYWVGNGGSWSDAANHWSATTNGAPGASIPLPQDTAIIDVSSITSASQTISSNVKRIGSVDFTGVANTPTWSWPNRIEFYGSLTMVAGITIGTQNDFWFMGRGSNTLTSGTRNFGAPMTVDVPSGTLTLQDAFSATTREVILKRGTLNTNGQTMAFGVFTSSSPSSLTLMTRVLTLGASVLTMSGNWNTGNTLGLTLNANTSAITLTGSGSDFNAGDGSLTFNNVTQSGAGICFLRGASTFANYTRTGTAVKTDRLRVFANQVITGTLTFTGNAAINRLLVISDTITTQRTFTAGAVAITNVDFTDIVGAGAASPFTGTSFGNALGNSGCTFTTPVDRYWIGGTGSWSATAEWSATSGGAGSASVPICHDKAIFDGNSFAGAGLTVTVDMPRMCADMEWTNATNSPTLTFNVGSPFSFIYGSVTLIAAMTITSNTNTVTLSARSAKTMGGGTFGNPVIIDAPSGTYTLSANLTLGATRTLTLTNGTIDGDTFNLSVGLFSSSNSNTRAIVMGSGNWTLSGVGSIWTITTATNLTITPETSTIIISDTSATAKTFAGNSKTYGSISFTGDNITVSGNNTFSNFGLNNAGVTNGLKLTSLTTQIVSSFSSTGSVGSLGKLLSTTAGSAATLQLAGGGGVSEDYMSLKDSTVTNGLWYAGANSTNVSGNTSWIFEAPPTSAKKSYGFMIA